MFQCSALATMDELGWFYDTAYSIGGWQQIVFGNMGRANREAIVIAI